jgi:polyisoprenoid-binding protein YceI
MKVHASFVRGSVAILAALGISAAAAAPVSYSIDPSHTFPRFEINHLGFSTHAGLFTKTSGKIVLDREAHVGSLEVTVDTGSILTGDAKLENHLKSPDFFDVAKHPTMTFKSTKMNFAGDVPTSVEGQLTLLGVTKPLTLQLSNVKFGQHPMAKKDWAGALAVGTLKRSEFGMTTYVPAVGDEVSLRIQVEAAKD